jgi:two-component system LytT family response regulator
MKTIRILVADDEPLARRGVRQLLAKHQDMAVVGECRNGHDTLRALETFSPDLLFLDIQMPEMNGFEVIRAAGAHRMPIIVFVTAHDEFAVQAFETHALDYLVKPLNADRFESTMVRVRERLKLVHDAQLTGQLEALLATERSARHENGVQHLIVSVGAGETVLPTSEIDWIEAEDYCSRLYVGTKTYLIRESLTSLQERLSPQHFARIHRSIIVRLERIREVRVTEGGSEIILQDGSRLPVSRRNRASLHKLLRTYPIAGPKTQRLG